MRDYCVGGEASAEAMESSTRGADDSEARKRELLRRRRRGTPAAWLANEVHVII